MPTHSLHGPAVLGCHILLSLGWMTYGAATLAQDGKSEYVVVSAQGATEAEADAATELADYLGKITGATFPVVPENHPATAPGRIFVGWTDFAARHKIDAAQLGDEEWVIRTVESDLMIVGGRPRGTLYGVYAFLERELGCHWLDQFSERERYYQVDTGPVLLPDFEHEYRSPLEGCRLAYVAHNRPEWAEFIVCVPTLVADAVKVHHYSQSIRIDGTRNRLIAVV